jgi:hypothetical protein
MQINDVIVEEDSSTVDEEDETRHRTMKFDTAIKGDQFLQIFFGQISQMIVELCI